MLIRKNICFDRQLSVRPDNQSGSKRAIGTGNQCLFRNHQTATSEPQESA
jgi:hypothetical protein